MLFASSSTFRVLTVLVLWASLSISLRAQTQPFIDGFSVGVGGSVFQGDLDFNSPNNPIAFIATADFLLFANVDRAVGPVVLEAGLQYDRLRLQTEVVAVDLNLLSLDLILGGARAEFFGGALNVRPFVGVSPGLQFPQYRGVDSRLEDPAYWYVDHFERLGTRPVVTFPFGLTFQDAIRIGVRLAASDNFDGWREGSPIDLVTYASVGYRVDLLRRWCERAVTCDPEQTRRR